MHRRVIYPPKQRSITHAVGYVRVSTLMQVHYGVSLQMQEEAITAFCKRRGIVLERIYQDEESGKTIEDRPGIQNVLTLLIARKVDALIVYKLDRAFRNTREALQVSDLCIAEGVQLCSVTEGLDTSTPHGRLFFTIMAAVAEWERGMVSERTRAAKQYLKSQGRKVGRFTDYGYTALKNGRLVENPFEKETIALARQMRSEGMSYRIIADELHQQGRLSRTGRKLSTRTIWRWCQNDETATEVYT